MTVIPCFDTVDAVATVGSGVGGVGGVGGVVVELASVFLRFECHSISYTLHQPQQQHYRQ